MHDAHLKKPHGHFNKKDERPLRTMKPTVFPLPGTQFSSCALPWLRRRERNEIRVPARCLTVPAVIKDFQNSSCKVARCSVFFFGAEESSILPKMCFFLIGKLLSWRMGKQFSLCETCPSSGGLKGWSMFRCKEHVQ